MFAIGQGTFHCFGHFNLAGAMFVIRVPLRQQPALAEELLDSESSGGGGHG